jgi:uncharacterized phiE125 gp8 family phage protein
MNWTLAHISGPTTEPLTLAEAKLHLQVDHTADDALITRLITAAREYAEAFTNRIIGAQTFVQTQGDCDPLGLTRYGTSVLPLFSAPLVSVEEISYVDPDGVTTQVWDSSKYQVVKPANSYGYVRPVYGETFPATRDIDNAVTISFTAGSDASASVKAGILLLIGHLYAHREAVIVDQTAMTLPLAVESLWTPYKVF